jgi:hypothetical protein
MRAWRRSALQRGSPAARCGTGLPSSASRYKVSKTSETTDTSAWVCAAIGSRLTGSASSEPISAPPYGGRVSATAGAGAAAAAASSTASVVGACLIPAPTA